MFCVNKNFVLSTINYTTMPRSKKRKHHHDHHTPPSLIKTGKKRNAVLVAVVFFGLLGLGIAYFAAGASIGWLIAGAAVGALAGYFFGRQIDSAASKK